jgi:hypothetical protein
MVGCASMRARHTPILGPVLSTSFAPIQELAAGIKLHPKVVRSEINLAFLASAIIDSILTGAFGSVRPISAKSPP